MLDSVPLISVIIPCFNYGQFLPEALESVLSQTYYYWECLIVDDGSTDNTKEIALSFTVRDARIKYIYQVNAGQAVARNTAFKQSKGKYIQFLDADDILESRKFELQIDLLESFEEIDLIYSQMMLFKHNNDKREYAPFQFNAPTVSGSNEILINSLMIDNFFLPGCTIFRRHLYEKVGGFRDKLYGLEDWNFWFRAALLGFEFYYDTRNGTRLLARDHGANISGIRYKMWYSRITSRIDIITYIDELRRENKLKVSHSYVAEIYKKQQVLLMQDKYRFHLYFGEFHIGIKYLFYSLFHSGKPFYALYDGLYWIKERFKMGVNNHA